MGRIEVNGTGLFVEDTGGDGPIVLFSHGLLWSGEMYRQQVAALRGRYRCITYDHRGQGKSDKPNVPSITIPQVTEDAAALIRHLDAGPVHFVGLSMGGYVGIGLAARQPELLHSLSLLATSADDEPADNARRYRMLCRVVSTLGTRPVTNKVMKIMFGRSFLEDSARAAERKEWREQLNRNRRIIVRAVKGVIERGHLEDELDRISLPTLILSGAQDAAIPPPRMDRLRKMLPHAEFMRIPDAGHTMTVETPQAVNDALSAFLDACERGRADLEVT